MRTMVTGVAGFVGSRLAAELLRAGHEVYGIDRMSDYYDVAKKVVNIKLLQKFDGFTHKVQDLCELEAEILPAGLDVVFHLAGQPGVRGSWGDAFSTYVRDNILGTQRLLECLATLTVPPRVIYSSSSSVYGAAESFPVPTTAIPRPLSPYGVTKLAGEALVCAYSLGRGVPAVTLRYFTVFGPGQRPDMAIQRMIVAAATGGAFTVVGDGYQVRGFTFVDDVVRANILAATTELVQDYELFNVAGEDEISVLALVSMVEQIVGRPVELAWVPAEPGEPRRTNGDNTTTRERLGWSPQVALRDGVAMQVAWHLSELECQPVMA